MFLNELSPVHSARAKRNLHKLEFKGLKQYCKERKTFWQESTNKAPNQVSQQTLRRRET